MATATSTWCTWVRRRWFHITSRRNDPSTSSSYDPKPTPQAKEPLSISVKGNHTACCSCGFCWNWALTAEIYRSQMSYRDLTTCRSTRMEPQQWLPGDMPYYTMAELLTLWWVTVKEELQGADSVLRCLTSLGNPIVEIRQSCFCLISRMGFPILVRWHLDIELGSRRYIRRVVMALLLKPIKMSLKENKYAVAGWETYAYIYIYNFLIWVGWCKDYYLPLVC